MNRVVYHIQRAFWCAVLRFAPTGCIQEALRVRPGVSARFVPSGKTETITVKGVCWLIVSED